MMIETDVLVIGADPAGSTAAKHAALGGASVIKNQKLVFVSSNGTNLSVKTNEIDKKALLKLVKINLR